MKKLLVVCLLALSLMATAANAASVSVTIGTYNTDVYKGGSVSVPFTVQVQNGTGSASITISPQSGLSCSECDKTFSFSGSGSQSDTFTLSADSVGTYTSPFTISATLGSASDSKAGSNTITVTEQPTIAPSLEVSASSVVSGSTVEISLSISVTGTVSGLQSTLSLPSGWTRVSGPETYTFGDVSAPQSASWTVTATSPKSSNTISVTTSATGLSAVTKTSAISGPSPGGGGNDGGGSSVVTSPGGGGGFIPPGQEKKNVTSKPLPPGLVNNTKLQLALEKVLAKGNMDQNAIDNLLRLSGIVNGQSTITRTITADTGKTEAKTKVKYSGNKTAKNYVVYEKIPKTFANSTDYITVAVEGATVEVVEKDPEYAIMFDSVNPGDELSITYTVNRKVSVAALDSFSTELYAESLEDAVACAQVITPARNPQTGECAEYPTPCDVPEGWVKTDSCSGQAGAQNELGRYLWVVYLIVVFAAVFGVYYAYKKGKLDGIISKLRKKPSYDPFSSVGQ